MSEPVVAQRSPYGVDLESGRTYHWCACGRSAKQPFCDGSHKTTTFTPQSFEAAEAKRYYLCGCKHSANKPYCDGTHKSV